MNRFALKKIIVAAEGRMDVEWPGRRVLWPKVVLRGSGCETYPRGQGQWGGRSKWVGSNYI